MTELTQCPVCSNSTFTVHANCKDYTVSHETFRIIQCNHCKLAGTSPRPTDDKLGAYYQSDEYISHSGNSSGGIGIIYKIARAYALKNKERLIRKYQQVESVLDFGCGTGDFLKTCKEKGWKISGVEPSEIARKKAEENTGIKIANSLQGVSTVKVSTITAWHVLEHVPDLHDTVKKLSSYLTINGHMIIAVPNYQSPDGQKYKDHWAGYDVPRHLWHFSQQSMTTLLEKNEFKVIDIVPMKLDAYYISLLSEKYLNNNHVNLLTLAKAFLSGLTSNIKASNNKNFSSLIYIARKA